MALSLLSFINRTVFLHVRPHKTTAIFKRRRRRSFTKRVTHQSKNIPPRLGAGRSVPEPEREHQLLSPPAAQCSVYSVARWRCAALSDLRHTINISKTTTNSKLHTWQWHLYSCPRDAWIPTCGIWNQSNTTLIYLYLYS